MSAITKKSDFSIAVNGAIQELVLPPEISQPKQLKRNRTMLNDKNLVAFTPAWFAANVNSLRRMIFATPSASTTTAIVALIWRRP
jgi:hypothetical protein